MDLEDGYLKRNLSNGGQVNRDRFAPIEMRAAIEVTGQRSPTGGPGLGNGYNTGCEAPPYYPPSVIKLLDRMADRYEELGLPEEAVRSRLSEYDRAVLERMDIVQDRDAREEAFFEAHRFTGWLRRIALA